MKRPKLFRDPVHDIIALDIEDPVERVLFELVNTRPVQRLRRVRQLGFANLVYHGAEHTRFTHSLGVLHTARRMFDAIADDFTDDDRMEVLAAALLHDIGHGPFSHAIETVTGIDHEQYSAQIVKDPETEVHQILSGVDKTLPRRVARYFEPQSEFPSDKQALRDLVSSQLDADRLDYIRRDGLTTGVEIGGYDFERIQTMLETYVGETSGGQKRTRLAVSYRAREAVEGYLMARFHMFKQVYLHKAVRAAEKMLEAILQRADRLRRDDYEFSEPMPPILARLLGGEQLSSKEFVSLDDMDVWMALKRWRHDSDPVLSRLAGGLLDRRLYKTIDMSDRDPVDFARLMDRANNLAEDRGYDPEYAVLSDRARDTPYRPYDPGDVRSSAHIPIIEPDGTVVPIERNSDIVHLLGRDTYQILRVCLPAELRDELQE
jgi:HD superfamily phosphohydrolase